MDLTQRLLAAKRGDVLRFGLAVVAVAAETRRGALFDGFRASTRNEKGQRQRRYHCLTHGLLPRHCE